MKESLNEIYDNNIVHNTILDRDSVMSCMEESYLLGKQKSQENYNSLRNAFEELLLLWGDYGKYNSSRNHMEEEWRKEAGLL
jgi:hypothetical protein